MRNRGSETSLEAKFCILTVGTLFVVLLGVGHLSVNGYRSVVTERKKEQFDAITRTLALSARQIVAGSDRALLDTLSARVRNSRMDLEYIVISDKQGRTLYAESKDLPETPYRPGMRWWLVVRRILGYGGINAEDIYSVSVPTSIGPDQQGSLTAGFTLVSMKRAVDDLQTRVILGIAVGLIFGILWSAVIGRGMSGALRSLVQAARAVSAGNFGVRVKTNAGGEIMELSEAFNYMTETLANSNERLIERANTDSLTGLYNHRYFQERIASELSRASRYGHCLSLLMIDIDFFKTFNDTYGHPAGDAALRNLALMLGQTIRETDIAARYGGEEFAVILPETSGEQAAVTAERVRQAAEQDGLTDGVEGRTPLTVSVGITTFPIDCADRIGLLSAADMALYKAKSLGRNRVAHFASDTAATLHTEPQSLCVLLQAEDLATVEALADAIDAKLKFPTGHSRTVGQLASLLGQKLGLPEADCHGLYLAALLRDVGQIAIPDSILGKPGALTEQEMTAIRTHPALGHAVVRTAPGTPPVLPAILHHHEHYDGSGYPSGLAGEVIPSAARILAVTDAYQSMITRRPHRKQMAPAEAQAELVRESSTQFDPKVVQAFLEVLAEQKQDRAA